MKRLTKETKVNDILLESGDRFEILKEEDYSKYSLKQLKNKLEVLYKLSHDKTIADWIQKENYQEYLELLSFFKNYLNIDVVINKYDDFLSDHR